MSTTNVEKEYVHEVYEAIAPHFSETRYKPWPLVEQFIRDLPISSLVADVGCGNGKYMGVNPLTHFTGSDRSSNLISICQSRGFEAMVADNLYLPYRDNLFDAVISIAVIHHFSTEDNRLAALKELTRILKPGGKLLVTVWATEQKGKVYEEQDVMVPWKLNKKFDKEKKNNNNNNSEKNNDEKTSENTSESENKHESLSDTTTEEKTNNSNADPAVHDQNIVLDDGASKKERKKASALQKKMKKQQLKEQKRLEKKNTEEEGPAAEEKVFKRYYHMFVKGELDGLASKISELTIEDCAYDHDNWYLKAVKK
jgi:ubiquinone/menaquinone biosynthesis C-methylase UbiE